MRYKLYSVAQLPILKINKIGYSADVKDTTFGPKKRDYFIVCYVLSGKGVYNGTALGEGEGFLVTPDITEHISADADDPWELLWFISIDPKMGELFSYYKADKNMVFKHDCPKELLVIRDFAISENRKTINEAKVLEMFFSVFQYHVKSENEFPTDKTAARKYLDFSVNYIKAHSGSGVSVSELTKFLGISQPYLYKIFKKEFGKSPKRFITDFRIKRAKELLEETEISVSEIAELIGFSDSFAFSKCFSSKTGISPTEYRSTRKEFLRELNDVTKHSL